jgi:hypothetical protein
MPKTHGMGMGVFVDGYDISGDYQSFSRIGGGPAVIETTGVDKYAFERVGGRRDGAADATTYFNPDTVAGGQAADRSHLVLKSLPLADRMIMITHPSGEAWNLVGKQINYDPTVAADGAITMATGGQGNGYGLEPAKLLTAGKVTQGAAGNLASVDFGAGAAFGLQAHLQVFAFTGTSATVKLQQSSDDGGADAFADVTGGAFVASTGRSTQRIQTARDQAVERYLRVVTTGTFTSLVFAVTAEINLTTVVY